MALEQPTPPIKPENPQTPPPPESPLLKKPVEQVRATDGNQYDDAEVNHFRLIEKMESENPEIAKRLRGILLKGKQLEQKHNIIITHRMRLYASQVKKFLAGEESFMKEKVPELEKGLEKMENVLNVYGEIPTKDGEKMNIHFYWGNMGKSLSSATNIWYFPSSPESTLHHEIMHSADHLTTGELKTQSRAESKKINKRNNKIQQLLQYASIQIGGTKLDFSKPYRAENNDQLVLEAAYHCEINGIKGSDYIQKIGNRFVIKGVPVNGGDKSFYGLSKSSEHIAVLWENFLTEGKVDTAFLQRCIDEKNTDTNPKDSLLYHLFLNFRKVHQFAPETSFTLENGSTVELSTIVQDIEEIDSSSFNFETGSNIITKHFNITPKSVITSENEMDARKPAEIKESDEVVKAAAMTRNRTNEKGENIAENIKKNNLDKKQTATDILPESFWKQGGYIDGNKEKEEQLDQFNAAVTTLNSKYHVTVDLELMNNMVIVDGKQGKDVAMNLSAMGDLSAVTESLQGYIKALEFYGPKIAKSFVGGTKVSIAWFDSYENDDLGTAAPEQVRLRKGLSSTEVASHELAHMIDYAFGDIWEKVWTDSSTFMENESEILDGYGDLSFEGFLAYKEISILSNISDGGVLDRANQEAAASSITAEAKLSETTGDSKKSISMSNGNNKKSTLVFKDFVDGVSSDYSLKNGEEDRAETWSNGLNNPEEIMSVSDPLLSLRFYTMCASLISQRSPLDPKHTPFTKDFFETKGIDIDSLHTNLSKTYQGLKEPKNINV